MECIKFVIISFILISNLFANENKDTSFNFQYAGEIGKYSFGIGKRWNSWLYQGVHYGVVPKEDSISKIETYAIKTNFAYFDYSYKEFFLDLYIAIIGYYVPGEKYDTKNLKGTPNGYYRQSTYRGILGLGFELTYDKEYVFYFESGVNDVWLTNKYNNNSIDLSDHISSALGFRFIFI